MIFSRPMFNLKVRNTYETLLFFSSWVMKTMWLVASLFWKTAHTCPERQYIVNCRLEVLGQYIHPGGGWGTPLCKLCAAPSGSLFAPFWSANGYTLRPFWSGMGYGFWGNYGSEWTYLSFQFQMIKKEREICKFEMDLKNFFVCPPI